MNYQTQRLLGVLLAVASIASVSLAQEFAPADSGNLKSLFNGNDLTGWDGDCLVAYTRIIPPGISYDVPGIGRVVTSPKYRKTGIGRKLMEESISKAFSQFNGTEIKIGAQVYLTKFQLL